MDYKMDPLVVKILFAITSISISIIAYFLKRFVKNIDKIEKDIRKVKDDFAEHKIDDARISAIVAAMGPQLERMEKKIDRIIERELE